MPDRGWRALAMAMLLADVACGSSLPPNVKEKILPVPVTPPSTVTLVKEEPKPEPFEPTSGPGDAPVAFVRDERSSRLDMPLPRGSAREEWRVPLGGPRREPCRGGCSLAQTPFVLTAGNRIAVVGGDGWVLFDTNGRRVDEAKTEGAGVRLDRVSGSIVPDEMRTAETPADAKVAARGGLGVMVKSGGIYIGERAIEGRFDALEVAVDDNGVACIVVRQNNDLLLWTVPISAGGGIGRHRIPSIAKTKTRRVLGPPVLGKSLRVLVVDHGLVALGLDGKKVWERRGVPTGGVSITLDDHVLVADEGRVVAIDPRGRETVLWSDASVVYVTPPILNARGILLVGSEDQLHAISFS